MLTRLKEKLSKSIKNKRLHVFGVFLLLSFSMWVFTKFSHTYTETTTLKLRYTGLAKDKIISMDSVPEINVRVSAYGFRLLSYYFSNQSLEVDLQKDTYISNASYVWVAKRAEKQIEARMGTSMEVLAISPDTIRFKFDTLNVKMVPVRLKSSIGYALGYNSMDSLRVQPDSIKIIGTLKDVNAIEFITTKELELKNVNSSLKHSVELDLPKANEELKFSAEKVEVTLEVEKFTEGTMEVPVVITNLPADNQINFFPKTIKVSYYVSLRNYRAIKASDFKIVCDYEEAKSKNQSFFTPTLTINNKAIKTAKMKQDKVEYIITK